MKSLHITNAFLERGLILCLVFGSGVLPAQAQTVGLMLIGEDTVLTQDHYGSTAITADGVTLDCDGHFIISDNPGKTTGVGIDSRHGVTVKNCHAIDHSRGFFPLLATDVTLQNNTATGNTWAGFDVGLTVGGMLISNEAFGNHYGIVLSRTSEVSMIGNIATGNVEGGIDVVASDSCFLINNNADDNVYFGLSLRATDNCSVIRNQACGNGASDGRLIGGSGNRFQANEFCTTSGF